VKKRGLIFATILIKIIVSPLIIGIQEKLFSQSASKFGLVVHIHDAFINKPESAANQYMDKIAESGAEWIRMDFLWMLIEPSENNFNWDVMDKIVIACKERGLKILGTLYSPPPKNPTPENWWPGWPPDDNFADKYAHFVSSVVERYRPGGILSTLKGWGTSYGVTHWELWNEPNQEDFWPGLKKYKMDKPLWVVDTDNISNNAYLYVDYVLKPGYNAAKESDPMCTVLLGGLYFINEYVDEYYLSKIIERGATNYFDVASVHMYHKNYSPDDEYLERTIYVPPNYYRTDTIFSFSKILDNLRQNPNYFPDKHIWVTEFGWKTKEPIEGSSATTDGDAVTREKQAEYLKRSYEIFANKDFVDVAFWYAFADNLPYTATSGAYGLVNFNYDGSAYIFYPKPSFYMYKYIAKGYTESGSTSQVYRGNMSELREKQAFIDSPGIASGIYLYTYVRDVRADIKFKYVYESQPLVIVESNGWSFANPNQGTTWAKVVSYEKNSANQYFGCTVQTAVYYVGYNIAGEYIGKWYPCEPSQITFNYVIIGSSIAENTYRTFQYTYSENSMDISDGVGCWSTGEGRDETRYLSPPSGYHVYENTWDKIPTGANRYSGDIGTYIDEANNRLVIKYHVDAVFWCPASNFNWRYYVYGRKPTEGTPAYPAPPLPEHIDTVPPELRVVLPDEGTWQKSSFTVSWTGFDNYSSTVTYQVEYKIMDSGGWQSWIDWTTQTSAIFNVPQGIPDGTTIYFRCRAQDAAGNLEDWPTEPDYDTYVRVDLTPPPAPTLVSPADGSATNDSKPTFDWSDVSDISGITYEINVYDSVGISKGRLISSEFTPIESLPSDVYFWRVRAIDDVGNESPWSEVWSVTIDTVSPGISSTYQVTRKDGSWVDSMLWTNTKTPSLKVTV
jgi:hypothetical protein